MIHYFNPGHETAVLNNSCYYQPAANLVKMRHDLEYLPAWYARPGDYVAVDKPLDKKFLHPLFADTLAKAIEPQAIKDIGKPVEVSFWGISPQVIHLFNQYKKEYNLDNLTVPSWKEEYRKLSSRYPGYECLAFLTNHIPEIDPAILPVYHNTIESIEESVLQNNKMQLVKSPYSSSGRGLVWLPPEALARSQKQLISGMLKRQAQVSIEPALDKKLDFSLHFDIDNKDLVTFLGYSLFQTNKKGAYELSLLDSQSRFEQSICSYIEKDLLDRVKKYLLLFIRQQYGGIYTGNIGVDMLVYQDEGVYKLNPCVEVNMRKSMGYLSLVLYERYIDKQSRGSFHIDYHKNGGLLLAKHNEWMKSNPPDSKDVRMRSGYSSLCPMSKGINYHAYILVKQ